MLIFKSICLDAGLRRKPNAILEYPAGTRSPECLQKETVELFEYGAERRIHQIHHKGDYQGSNRYNHCTILQFAPGRPGNLMDQFVIGFTKIGSDFLHDQL
jgi:hypothetical protein